MGDLMRDHGTDAAEVDCREQIGHIPTDADVEVSCIQGALVEWRLHDGGRENDLVVQGVEIRVDVLRIHLPFGLVLYGIDLLQKFRFVLEGRDLAMHREQAIARRQHQVAEALPLVWVPELDNEFGQFQHGLLLRFFREPVVVCQGNLHNLHDLFHHPVNSALVLLRKKTRDVDLAHQLTHPRVYQSCRAFLGRLLRFLATKLAAIKVEVFLVEFLRAELLGRCNHPVLQIGFDVEAVGLAEKKSQDPPEVITVEDHHAVLRLGRIGILWIILCVICGHYLAQAHLAEQLFPKLRHHRYVVCSRGVLGDGQ
mmetsp:Transcript_22459/g.62833  ORF Transcript_22459/g.62833 Transcript_22459/m.62833 type:complete len:311 (-) Transcript_22459:288-1220(-)